MASSFMSGLISGFMAFGGGGAMGGAGGDASAAGGASGAGGGAGGIPGMGGGSGASTGGAGGSITPASAGTGAAASGGGENIGTTSQALSTGGGGSSSGGSGDIIRTNPYGTGSTTPANASGPSDSEKFGKSLQDIGKQEQQNAGKGGSTSMPQTTYSALFGSGSNAFQTPTMGGGMVSGPPQIQAPPIASAQLARPDYAPVSSPTALPAPMAIPMSSPNPAPVAPVQLPLGAVSDVRAKTRIHAGNKDLENLLDRVYTNLAKRKR